jgi:predicted RNase H-like nuclease (RuvC/YqgF family)
MAKDSLEKENISKDKTQENLDETLKLIQEERESLNETLKLMDVKKAELEKLQNDLNTANEEATSFSKLKEVDEVTLRNDSVQTGAELKKEKKITITIPKSELNPHEMNVPVTVNGWTYNIKRGESVEVPMTVFNILKEAKYL